MDAVDHVVLGAGAVGMAIAEALARRGESVRVVNRSGLREPIAGVQSVTGDITDPAFAASATRGARVVYQALNPPYHRWAQEFPGLQAAAIAAAQAITPAWQMRALGLVNRTVREISEMRYEFDEPFVVDASRAETALGLRATPLADAVQQTVRWYRDQAIASPAADRNGA